MENRKCSDFYERLFEEFDLSQRTSRCCTVNETNLYKEPDHPIATNKNSRKHSDGDCTYEDENNSVTQILQDISANVLIKLKAEVDRHVERGKLSPCSLKLDCAPKICELNAFIEQNNEGPSNEDEKQRNEENKTKLGQGEFDKDFDIIHASKPHSSTIANLVQDIIKDSQQDARLQNLLIHSDLSALVKLQSLLQKLIQNQRLNEIPQDITNENLLKISNSSGMNHNIDDLSMSSLRKVPLLKRKEEFRGKSHKNKTKSFPENNDDIEVIRVQQYRSHNVKNKSPCCSEERTNNLEQFQELLSKLPPSFSNKCNNDSPVEFKEDYNCVPRNREMRCLTQSQEGETPSNEADDERNIDVIQVQSITNESNMFFNIEEFITKIFPKSSKENIEIIQVDVLNKCSSKNLAKIRKYLEYQRYKKMKAGSLHQ